MWEARLSTVILHSGPITWVYPALVCRQSVAGSPLVVGLQRGSLGCSIQALATGESHMKSASWGDTVCNMAE